MKLKRNANDIRNYWLSFYFDFIIIKGLDCYKIYIGRFTQNTTSSIIHTETFSTNAYVTEERYKCQLNRIFPGNLLNTFINWIHYVCKYLRILDCCLRLRSKMTLDEEEMLHEKFNLLMDQSILKMSFFCSIILPFFGYT